MIVLYFCNNTVTLAGYRLTKGAASASDPSGLPVTITLHGCFDRRTQRLRHFGKLSKFLRKVIRERGYDRYDRTVILYHSHADQNDVMYDKTEDDEYNDFVRLGELTGLDVRVIEGISDTFALTDSNVTELYRKFERKIKPSGEAAESIRFVIASGLLIAGIFAALYCLGVAFNGSISIT